MAKGARRPSGTEWTVETQHSSLIIPHSLISASGLSVSRRYSSYSSALMSSSNFASGRTNLTLIIQPSPVGNRCVTKFPVSP